MKNIDRRSAFTLVELLVVVAIIGIVATFAVPAARTMLQGSALVQGSNMLVDQMSFARQTAISKNRLVEVRFYRFGDPEVPGEKANDPKTGHFRAFEIFEISPTGVVLPVSKSQMMPDAIIMNPGEKLSSLLGVRRDERTVESAELNKDIDPQLPRGVGHNYDYVAFRFLPDGTTNLPPLGFSGTSSDKGLWFITIHALNDLAKTGTAPDYDTPPPDFVTWQIDPVSGTSKTFRRGVK